MTSSKKNARLLRVPAEDLFQTSKGPGLEAQNFTKRGEIYSEKKSDSDSALKEGVF